MPGMHQASEGRAHSAQLCASPPPAQGLVQVEHGDVGEVGHARHHLRCHSCASAQQPLLERGVLAARLCCPRAVSTSSAAAMAIQGRWWICAGGSWHQSLSDRHLVALVCSRATLEACKRRAGRHPLEPALAHLTASAGQPEVAKLGTGAGRLYSQGMQAGAEAAGPQRSQLAPHACPAKGSLPVSRWGTSAGGAGVPPGTRSAGWGAGRRCGPAPRTAPGRRP